MALHVASNRILLAEQQEETLEQHQAKRYNPNDEQGMCMLDILDTAGTEQFTGLFACVVFAERAKKRCAIFI
jgi:hypothetical protein